jgi:hypothetical protein
VPFPAPYYLLIPEALEPILAPVVNLAASFEVSTKHDDQERRAPIDIPDD